MGTTHLHYPRSPQRGGKLASRLILSNWRSASALRYHKHLGLIRVSLVGMRYFDRGAGGFMGGGAWVYEGRVVCATYPEMVEGDEDRIPEIRSVAGWGFAGDAPSGRGRKVKIADRRASRPEVVGYEKAFWTIDEALDYANGEDDGAIGKDTFPVRVRLTNAGYRITSLTPEGG
jgi:hypothetical protein